MSLAELGLGVRLLGLEMGGRRGARGGGGGGEGGGA